MLIWLLLQAVAAPTAPADIQLSIRATAKSVRIDQKGEARLAVTAEPDAGSVINKTVPPIDRAATDVTVSIDAEARIADPNAAAPR